MIYHNYPYYKTKKINWTSIKFGVNKSLTSMSDEIPNSFSIFIEIETYEDKMNSAIN